MSDDDNDRTAAVPPPSSPESPSDESADWEFVSADNADKNENEQECLVGEVESDTPPGENEEFAPEKMSAEMQPLPLSQTLKELIAERIDCLRRLEQLDTARQQFASENTLADSVKNALAAQSAEAKILPGLVAAREKQKAFAVRVQSLRQKFAAAQGDAAPPPEFIAHNEQVWRYAAKQYDILIQRGKYFTDIIQVVSKEYCAKEPLFCVCRHFGYAVEKVFALAIYKLALDEWLAHLNAKRKELLQQLNELDAQKSLNPFAHKKNADIRQQLQSKIDQTSQTITLFTRDGASLQKELIDEYWGLYEFAACLYVSPKPNPAQALVIRMLLRYGVLGHAPYFLAPRSLQFIKQSCHDDVEEKFNFAMNASHVLYADEYLRFIIDGDITPSIDENLELTGRHSPEWHNDKAQRRLTYSRAREHALHEQESALRLAVEALREQQEKLEIKKSKLFHSDPEFKKKNAELAQKIQHCKVEAARFIRIIDRINTHELADVHDKAVAAYQRIQTAEVKVNRYVQTRKEVAAVHRVCRLCARLKDSFPPFSLRDFFRPENNTVNHRPAMRAMLQEAEECDRFIFQEVLVNSRNVAQRIHLRFHPVVLLAPNYGFLGYSWNPRTGVETGKLVFPLYCPRQGINVRILRNMLADFQWDTSKASAGVNVLTSDTLVAAYATVRWDYRKRKRENREKCLIFNEINDRQNWRRHYTLFLESAKDSGRKLFFKNPEVYEVAVKYLTLPPGCEKLRH